MNESVLSKENNERQKLTLFLYITSKQYKDLTEPKRKTDPKDIKNVIIFTSRDRISEDSSTSVTAKVKKWMLIMQRI